MSDEPPSTAAAGGTDIGEALTIDGGTVEVSRGHLVVSGRDVSGMSPPLDVVGLCTITLDTLVDEEVDVGQLDLLFVDESEMADLNLSHMGHPGPTDVLAFPLDADELLDSTDSAHSTDGPPVLLGDVVVCPTVAERQAAGHTGSFDAELALLLVHGVLHVLGHDHTEGAETKAMQERERHHLSRLGHRHPAAR